MYIDEKLNDMLRLKGWLTVEELLEPQPLDLLLSHAGVHNLETLEQWVRMERGTYTRIALRNDLGINKINEEYLNSVESKLVILREMHANIRKVIKNVV